MASLHPDQAFDGEEWRQHSRKANPPTKWDKSWRRFPDERMFSDNTEIGALVEICKLWSHILHELQGSTLGYLEADAHVPRYSSCFQLGMFRHHLKATTWRLSFLCESQWCLFTSHWEKCSSSAFAHLPTLSAFQVLFPVEYLIVVNPVYPKDRMHRVKPKLVSSKLHFGHMQFTFSRSIVVTFLRTCLELAQLPSHGGVIKTLPSVVVEHSIWTHNTCCSP